MAIVKKVAAQLGISRHVSIQRFGAAINCFTVLAGLVLSGQSCENSIFVLDGDVYRTDDDKTKKLNAVLTGNDENAKSLRESSLNKVKCLNLPEGTKPEKHIHSVLISLSPSGDEHLEIVNVAKQVIAVNNDHKYVDDVIRRLDWDRRTGLSKIIDECIPVLQDSV